MIQNSSWNEPWMKTNYENIVYHYQILRPHASLKYWINLLNGFSLGANIALLQAVLTEWHMQTFLVNPCDKNLNQPLISALYVKHKTPVQTKFATDQRTVN